MSLVYPISNVPRQLADSLRDANVGGDGAEHDEEEGEKDDHDVGRGVARSHRVQDPQEGVPRRPQLPEGDAHVDKVVSVVFLVVIVAGAGAVFDGVLPPCDKVVSMFRTLHSRNQALLILDIILSTKPTAGGDMNSRTSKLGDFPLMQ